MEFKKCKYCGSNGDYVASLPSGVKIYKCNDCMSNLDILKHDHLNWEVRYEVGESDIKKCFFKNSHSLNNYFIVPDTRTYVPDRSKFKSWEDVIDYLIATGFKIEVKQMNGISYSGLDLETIKKYSK